MDASNDAKRPLDGSETQRTQPAASPPSLPEAIGFLTGELREHNQLLRLLVEQNAALMEMIVDEGDGEEDAPEDISGARVRVS